MNPDIKKRLSGLENIFQSLNENIDILEFLVIDLYPEKFNYQNNKFLMWLWRMTLSQQIITFYHVVHPKEKHSLRKILNLLNEAKIEINYDSLNELIINLTEEYSKNKFEIVRSKYLAHKDINVEQVKTDLQSVRNFTQSLIETYKFLLNELKLPVTVSNKEIKLSLWEIFAHINEYENLLKYINFEEKNGRETLLISEIIKMRTL